MIMQGKEVGSIIGRKGDNVKKFRDDSGAKINISDNSCLERIVTVMGTTSTVTKAFTMIASKLEEDIQAIPNSAVPKPPVTMKLIVPASQCGSLIGKGGSKINEIREETGASIQVASEMLPNSTERTVTISGSAESIGQSVGHISSVFVESPPKGATIPYRPKPPIFPVIYTAGGAPVAATGAFCHMSPNPAAAHFGTLPPHQSEIMKLQQIAMSHHHNPHLPFLPSSAVAAAAATGQQIMAGTASMNFSLGNAGTPVNANPNANAQSQTHEMTVPNDLIGCIIGRGGCKINEIRQLSRATIKIANCEEGSSDRKVTIQGTPDTVNAAQYLINARISSEVCGFGLR